MPIFRRRIPQRAALGAFVGFLYSLVILLRGDLLAALGWFLLAIALLFSRPAAYYGYVTWALLWMVWRGVVAFQGKAGAILWAVVDVFVPLVSIVLVSSSGYLESLREDEPEITP